MDERTFWTLVESLDWSKEGDDDGVIEPAVSTLAEMNGAEIQAFQEILAEKLYALDTKAHARNIGEDAYVSARVRAQDA